jgi:hypothetical protein
MIYCPCCGNNLGDELDFSQEELDRLRKIAVYIAGFKPKGKKNPDYPLQYCGLNRGKP